MQHYDLDDTIEDFELFTADGAPDQKRWYCLRTSGNFTSAGGVLFYTDLQSLFSLGGSGLQRKSDHVLLTTGEVVKVHVYSTTVVDLDVSCNVDTEEF
jgi:hypothetical protein